MYIVDKLMSQPILKKMYFHNIDKFQNFYMKAWNKYL